MKRVAENLRKQISSEPIDPVGKITASLGVTLLRSSDQLATWLKRADEALYAAKRAGRDRVVNR